MSGRTQLPPLVATDDFVVAVVVAAVAVLVFAAVLAVAAEAVGVAAVVAVVTAAAVAVDAVAVDALAVDVRLDGTAEVVEVPDVEAALDWSTVVLVAAATALVEPTPPASPTVNRPALATEPTAAETLTNRTRRRARSRCSTELRIVPRAFFEVPRGFFEFVMHRPSGIKPHLT